MECRLVLNNRTNTDITDKDMSGYLRYHLKFYKFRRVPTKTGKSIFYLFFRREEDTYFALRAAKSIKKISLVRYRPSKPIPFEAPFRVSAPQRIVDIPRFAFANRIDRFDSMSRYKSFIRRVSQQIMAQYIRTDEIHERIEKLTTWFWMNEHFIIKDDYSVQKLLDIFFG